MFVVLLKFGENRDRMRDLMEGHNHWIEEGFADDVFLMVGGIVPGIGGAVLAHKTTRTRLEKRVADDPFVAEGVVSAEIIEIAPGRIDPRLGFLTGN